MIAVLDVDYREDNGAVAACVVASDWTDASAVGEYAVRVYPVAPYEPGQFYKRELPCLLAVLETLPAMPSVCVVDGYVWLGDETRPGLGAHLFTALGGTIPVVGVAKTRFAGAAPVAEVLHGTGDAVRPLYVSAVGVLLANAAERVARMHGPFRLPTLCKRVDALCRAAHPS